MGIQFRQPDSGGWQSSLPGRDDPLCETEVGSARCVRRLTLSRRLSSPSPGNALDFFEEGYLVPTHPHVFFELPSSLNMLIHILIYAAGTAVTALGGFHGYRYCGGRFSKQEREA